MALTSIQKVRSLVGDMEKASTLEVVGTGASSDLQYQTDLFPLSTGSVSVYVSGVLAASATVSYDFGIIDFTGVTTTVTAGAQVTVSYKYFALSNDEVQAFLDVASGGGALLAASYAARSLASQSSKFFAYTQGSRKVDKTMIAKRLNDIADGFQESYDKNLKNANVGMTVTSFDDSGTAFEGFDTGSAYLVTGLYGDC